MPELPDVEVYRRYLEAHALHQPIERVELRGAGRMLGRPAAEVRDALTGRALDGSARHGKYLFAHIAGNGWLVLHFGMTGYLDYRSEDEQDPGHDVLVLFFRNGAHLAFNCRRKLGAIDLADAPENLVRDKGLGPDLLALSESEFLSRLRARGGTAKGFLMDQAVLAGLGNVYSDEVLFQAALHPKTPLGRIGDREGKRLFRAMRRVLEQAIAADADPDRMPKDFLLPLRGRKGARCPYCGGPPRRISASGRHAWYCPCRQPEPP